MSCTARARRSRTLSKYGLTTAQYAKLLKLQGGACAICGKKPRKGSRRLAVDHAHDATKRVRGLACFRCNRYKIAGNDVQSARRVLAYLESELDGRDL